MVKFRDRTTVDEILAFLEDVGIDQPIIIESRGYRHHFESLKRVRSSREYTGDVFLGIDPVIWYESEIDMIWRDPDEDIAVITLIDEEA